MLIRRLEFELPLVSTFKIHLSILKQRLVDCSHEVHVFVDASQKAMCAVAYIRSVQCETAVVSFLVDPIRTSNIPKVELQATVIGLQLSMSIHSFLRFRVQNCFFSGATDPLLFNGFLRPTNVSLFSLIIVWQKSQTVVMLNKTGTSKV